MSTRLKDIPGNLTLASLAALACDRSALAAPHRSFSILKAHAGPIFLGKSLESLTHADFQVVLDRYLAQQPARSTGIKLIAEFNAILVWAVACKYRKTPFKPFRRPRKKSKTSNLLSQEQIDSILMALDQNYQADFTARIAVRALVWLGLGVKETRSFSLEQVNFDTGEYIQRDVEGRLRFIPIPSPMLPLLKHARTRKALTGSVGGEKIWIALISLRALVKDLGERCRIPGLTLDQLKWTGVYGERPPLSDRTSLVPPR